MKKEFGVSVIVMAILFGAVYTDQSWAAAKWDKNYASYTLSGVAGQRLTNLDVVCVKQSDGKVYKADADSATLTRALGLVVANSAVATNSNVTICFIGKIVGTSNLTKGNRVYLSTIAGGITQTPPTANAEILGTAVSATSWVVNVAGSSNMKGFAISFANDNIVTNQSAMAMNVAGSSTVTSGCVPYDGYISAITVNSNEAITSGSIILTVKIGNTATALATMLDVSNPASNSATTTKLAIPVIAGQNIGVSYTTTTNYAPTTADYKVDVYYETAGAL